MKTLSQRLEITPLFCISRVWLKLNCLLIGNQWISCLLCFCLCVQGVSHWTKTGCEGVQIDIFRNNWRDDLSKTSLQTGICYWFSHGSFSFVSPGWLYWINPTNLATGLKARGILGNPLGEYYRHISLAAHLHASRLTHWQTRTQLYFNSVTFILRKLFLYFEYYWTVAQIENMRIVYHCLTSQFWNLAHVKNKPVIFRYIVDMIHLHSPRAAPSVNESHIPSLPKNKPHLYEQWSHVFSVKR